MNSLEETVLTSDLGTVSPQFESLSPAHETICDYLRISLVYVGDITVSEFEGKRVFDIDCIHNREIEPIDFTHVDSCRCEIRVRKLFYKRNGCVEGGEVDCVVRGGAKSYWDMVDEVKAKRKERARMKR